MVTGKLPNDLLEDIVFKHIKHKRPEVITGAAVGEDNALLDFGDDIVVLSTDPITGAANNIGSLAVNISCNDIATSGGEPIGLLLTILAPPETTHEDIEKIMKDAGETAAELNVAIIGGHTEITDAVNRVLVSTTAIGKVKRKKLQRADYINIGDKILISKSSGIEGTSILLSDFESYFKDKLDQDMIEEGKNYGKDISVLKEGKIGGEIGINYMHDITEGGVLGAIWEAHKALDKGIQISKDLIPITDVTRKLCEILDINPLRLISSGSMLMIASSEQLKELQDRFSQDNLKLTVIGEIVDEGLYIEDNGVLETIEAPDSDELYKALGKLNNE